MPIRSAQARKRLARVASLVGEPARTAMLMELMDGRALTARELAAAAGVLAPTASGHLALLVEGGLLRAEPHGRHRYHRLASAEVAKVLEGIMQLASRRTVPPHAKLVVGPKEAALRRARTCYDHVAGRLGVAIAKRLLDDGAIVFDAESGRVTRKAVASLAGIGLALDGPASAASSRRAACRPCLDWSERTVHVAGTLGAMICAHCLERRWLTRRPGSRALDVTAPGRMALRDWLGAPAWQQVEGA